MIIVSACLLGIKCRYDGESRPEDDLLLVKENLLPVCPEQLGGLSTPRLPSGILCGDGEDVIDKRTKVVNSANMDVTNQFLRGAMEVLKIAHISGIDTAIMKEMSPSCGVHFIKKGGIAKAGMGVTSALLARNGIKIISSDRIKEDYLWCTTP
jgi:uncharacterized protein YbbK (DUF523 family)